LPRAARIVFSATKLAYAASRSEGGVGCETNQRIDQTAIRVAAVAGDAPSELADPPVPRRRLLCVATDTPSHHPPRLPLEMQSGLARLNAVDVLFAKRRAAAPACPRTPVATVASNRVAALDASRTPGRVLATRLHPYWRGTLLWRDRAAVVGSRARATGSQVVGALQTPTTRCRCSLERGLNAYR
jgi:hypothetical protein